MIDIYNSNPYVMNYASSGGIWWIFVFVTDSSLSHIQPLSDASNVCMQKEMTEQHQTQTDTDRICEFKNSELVSKSDRITYDSLERQFVHCIPYYIHIKHK